jgi:hypothetical protein
MSFILDALKKSETDRQRQNGPALFEVRVAPPRNSLPLWAVGLAVLLAVNLVIVAWVLLRRPAAQDAADADAASRAGGQQYAGAQPGNPGSLQGPGDANRVAGVQQPFGPAGSSTAGSGPGGPLGQTAGMTQPAGAGVAAGPGGYGPQGGTGVAASAGYGQQGGAGGPGATGYAQGAPGAAGYGQQGAAGAAGSPAGYGQQGQGGAGAPGAAGYAQQGGNANGAANGAGNAPGGAPTDAGGLNPDDYAPAADPPPMPGFANRVTRSTSSGVPLYQDVAQTNHLANLHLDLHVFAANPQQRFVMINTHKLREGDALPEGVRVESITPEGAVLSQNGTRFLLPRE